MPPLQVKDFPADVYERLRQCAREENRSISQQTLTIIEDYLNMRDSGSDLPRSGHALIPSFRTVKDEIDYGARRRKVIEQIEKHPLPGTDVLPSSAELIRQIRDEEAR